MSSEPRPKSDLETLRTGVLKHARTAALVASLVPLAQVAVAPLVVSAQYGDGCTVNCPTKVPEPATLILLAPAAAMLLRRRRK